MKGSFAERISAKTALIVIAACGAGILTLFVLDFVTYGLAFILFFLRFILFATALYFGLCRVPKEARLFGVARFIRRGIVFCGLFFLITFGILLSLMIWDSTPGDTNGVEYVIVAGAGLRGSEPSPILRQRLERALVVLEENPDAVAILTGGKGKREDITEAEAMKIYLVNRGISEDRLLKEEASRDTAENIANATQILREKEVEGPVKTAVVTSDFHMFRSKRLAERNGLIPVAAPAQCSPAQWHYYFREYFSILIYVIELTGLTLDTSALGL